MRELYTDLLLKFTKNELDLYAISHVEKRKKKHTVKKDTAYIWIFKTRCIINIGTFVVYDCGGIIFTYQLEATFLLFATLEGGLG